MMSEKTDAESMIPAAKPRKMRLSLGLIVFVRKKRTKDEPSVVQRKMREIPTIELTIGDIMILELALTNSA